MSFGEDLRLFTAKVDDRARLIFEGSVTEIHRSITEGSEITAAPGQPVGQFRRYTKEGEGRDPYVGGFLKGSWLVSFPDEWIGEISTNVVYAEFIEEGGYEQRSTVGGPHSVALTRTNFDRIVQDQVRTHTGG